MRTGVVEQEILGPASQVVEIFGKRADEQRWTEVFVSKTKKKRCSWSLQISKCGCRRGSVDRVEEQCGTANMEQYSTTSERRLARYQSHSRFSNL